MGVGGWGVLPGRVIERENVFREVRGRARAAGPTALKVLESKRAGRGRVWRRSGTRAAVSRPGTRRGAAIEGAASLSVAVAFWREGGAALQERP